MANILQDNRKLEAEKDLLIQRTEKLRLAQNRILSLEKDLTEKKELLAVADKKKTELIIEKNEVEDKEFNLSNRLKQTEMRFNAMKNQLDETMSENATL